MCLISNKELFHCDVIRNSEEFRLKKTQSYRLWKRRKERHRNQTSPRWSWYSLWYNRLTSRLLKCWLIFIYCPNSPSKKIEYYWENTLCNWYGAPLKTPEHLKEKEPFNELFKNKFTICFHINSCNLISHLYDIRSKLKFDKLLPFQNNMRLFFIFFFIGRLM